MIFVPCKHRGPFDRVPIVVCETTCGQCIDYEKLMDRVNEYIDIFYVPELCLACGGTGITETAWECDKCGAVAPWRYPDPAELEIKKNGKERD